MITAAQLVAMVAGGSEWRTRLRPFWPAGSFEWHCPRDEPTSHEGPSMRRMTVLPLLLTLAVAFAVVGPLAPSLAAQEATTTADDRRRCTRRSRRRSRPIMSSPTGTDCPPVSSWRPNVTPPKRGVFLRAPGRCHPYPRPEAPRARRASVAEFPVHGLVKRLVRPIPRHS